VLEVINLTVLVEELHRDPSKTRKWCRVLGILRNKTAVSTSATCPTMSSGTTWRTSCAKVRDVLRRVKSWT